MQSMNLCASGVLAILLAACSGSQEPEVAEQIVVREPGAATPAASGIAASSVMAAEGNADIVTAGKSAFAMCSACHVVEPGAPSAAGPNLHGVVGREAGSLADFAYSEALQAADITWDTAQLDAFLANPSAKFPGTNMAAGAVRDEQRRAQIIAYLETL